MGLYDHPVLSNLFRFVIRAYHSTSLRSLMHGQHEVVSCYFWPQVRVFGPPAYNILHHNIDFKHRFLKRDLNKISKCTAIWNEMLRYQYISAHTLGRQQVAFHMEWREICQLFHHLFQALHLLLCLAKSSLQDHLCLQSLCLVEDICNQWGYLKKKTWQTMKGKHKERTVCCEHIGAKFMIFLWVIKMSLRPF